MHEIPECLNRRYRALDELIRELSTAIPPRGSMADCPVECPSETNSAGIRLMCNFWNILQENPDCDLHQEVQQRMNVIPRQSKAFGPQHIACYMAGRSCCQTEDKKKRPQPKVSCCQSRTPSDSKQKFTCCASKSVTPSASESIPLSKVLCNLKEAASFEKKCTAKVSKLMETQKELQSQITVLEEREKEGVKLLKQADCMWSCMEDSYKTKVADSLERQKVLIKQMKEIEASANKWRKNKKDLEFQLANVGKCHIEIKEKMNEKTNDLKLMDTEIEDLKKRVINAKKDTENAKNSLSYKKASCDAKIAKIMQKISRIQKQLADEQKHKVEKETEGNGYIKEAREDLQKICKLMLRKKLENEDLLAEKAALLEEIEVLKQTCDLCKDKCKNRQNTVADEIKKIDEEIANYRVKCIRCHQCTDTIDVRKLCSDCPRCKEERECFYEDDHCSPDHTMDCVCISIKQKFLDNVFDNMYTVLERQGRTGPGKAVAEAVLKCLRRSRNGKLDNDTKKILQEFILTTVKKNLNLTIVGGAVKTRCEMDAETYKQLMLCLKQVKVTQPPKEDKGTLVKKDPCYRWGGTSECNCPKGPKGCICTKKAPPPPREPLPCPPPPPDKEDAVTSQSCPHVKESAACGPDCALHAVPSAVGTDVSAWRPDPCKGQTCPFSKNMRAAQCMLGPESLSSVPERRTITPYVPSGVTGLDSMNMTCDCGVAPANLCTCREDRRCRPRPRQRIIDEVMGRYTELSPIENVVTQDHYCLTEMATGGRKEKKCDRTDWVTSVMCENRKDAFCSCSCAHTLNESLKSPITIKRKASISIGKYLKDNINLASKVEIPTVDHRNSNIVSHNENDVQVILCPKFKPYFKKSGETIETSTTINFEKSFSISDLNFVTQNKRYSLDSYDASYVGRKICDTVRELMKDLGISDENKALAPNNEWVTVESLYKEIEKLTKSEHPSEITLNEVEMSCELLESPKDTVHYMPTNKLRVYAYAKHLKAGEVKIFDKNSKCKCPMNRCRLSEIGTTNIADEMDTLTENFKTEQVDEQISSKHDKYNTVNKLLEKNKIDSNKTLYNDIAETPTKLAILTSNSEVDIQFIELSKTSMGDLTVELDERVVQHIEKRLSEDSNLFLSLKETDTGYNLIYIDETHKHNKVNENKRVMLKMTPSGNKIFEIRKSIIRILKPDSIKSSPNNSQFKDTVYVENSTPFNNHSSNLIGQIPYEIDLQLLYDQGHRIIQIKIERDGRISKENVALIKTSSESIAVDIQNTLLPGITFPKKYSVLLTKSSSGTYSLNLNYNQSPNAILKTSTSGHVLLTINSTKRPLEHFKIKVSSDSINVTELPAVLKTTNSLNYVIVLDKEFEKIYRKTIQDSIGDNNQCYVDLNKTDSGSFVINLYDADETSIEDKNALLVKTSTGSFKIYVKGAILDSIHNLPSKKSSVFSSKTFGELLHKLPASSREFHREKLRKSKFLATKSISDSNLNNKGNRPDDKDMMSKSNIKLKKTPSGKYAVVLNKESKKEFINYLKTYLAVNSQGLVPMRKTESGDITIVINNNKEKGFHGSLKITSSGNIYIMVDESFIKQKVKKDTKQCGSSTSVDAGPSCIIDTIRRLINKAVATTCNAKPDDCSCDASQCVCEDLRWDATKCVYEPGKNESLNVQLNDVQSAKKCNLPASDSTSSPNKMRKVKSPHIVIKPTSCSSTLNNSLGSQEQCYYVIGTVCSYHKNRYESVSNDLIEITGFCNTLQNNVSRNIEFEASAEISGTRGREMIDSLNFLPPQLPPFLRNVNYH